MAGQLCPKALPQHVQDGLAIAGGPWLIVLRMVGTDIASAGIGSSMFRVSRAGAHDLHNQIEEE